jgi:Toastrack DUF4097
MRRSVIFLALPIAVFVLAINLSASPAAGQTPSGNWQTGPCGEEGNGHSRRGDQSHVCELRRTTFKLGGDRLGVDSENGGIEVLGEERSDIAVEARVEAWAGSQSEANDILRQVQIETSGDKIRDHGPRSGHVERSGYGVNYRLHVPHRLAVELHSMNGGIDISHLEGDIRFETTNGGVQLNDLAGKVQGQTVNGGLQITLTGNSWQGEGLQAETTNGGVELNVPEDYNAHLEAGTVNGGISVDFPVTIQGQIKNHVSTDIGSGGSLIHAETTNGGIQIRRS